MVEEARLEDVGSGLAPVSPGWFVVNVGEAAWLRHDAFGGRCVFESSGRVLAERPDLEPQMFEQLGFTLAVLEPGKPTGMYHAESSQEDFLVLAGTCLLIVEEEERELRAWDFVHCPPGTLPHVRRHRRRAVRDLHDRRTSGGRHDRLSRFGDGAGPRRRRRDRDEQPARGVRAVRPLAPRPAGRLVPTALEPRQLRSLPVQARGEARTELRQKVGPLVQGTTAVASPGRRRRSRPRACR